MSESTKLPDDLAELLAHLHARQEKRGNCTMKDRAELWLRYGGENLDISPPNFHHALATWLENAGLVHKDKSVDVAAALYCLGVTNSNNLFQKVNQGKLVTMGIGKNGRRNAKGKK
jgi:integrase